MGEYKGSRKESLMGGKIFFIIHLAASRPAFVHE